MQSILNNQVNMKLILFPVSKVLFVSMLYISVNNFSVMSGWGVQWLSGRVLDSRQKGRGFEPHRYHCVVSLSKTH